MRYSKEIGVLPDELAHHINHNKTYGREDVPRSVAVTIQYGNQLEDDTRAK